MIIADSNIGVDDDTQRRDKLHALINNLPDAHYATLRAIILVGQLLILIDLVDHANILTASQQGPRTLFTEPYERWQYCYLLWVSSLNRNIGALTNTEPADQP